MTGIVAIPAVASLAVSANVSQFVAGVGLEAAAFLDASGAGSNADKVTAATAMAAAAVAAARIGANGSEGQSARHEKCGNRSFDRRTHDKLSFSSPALPQLLIQLLLLQRQIELSVVK
jgi:hypothetical protein